MQNVDTYMKPIYKAIEYATDTSHITNYNWKETLKDRTVVAFGLGKFFEDTHERLFSMIDIAYLCDNNECLWGGDRYGKKILSPDEMKNIENVFVIIVMGNPLAVMEQLKRRGVEYIHISELHFSYYEKGTDTAWLTDSKEKIQNALALLQDDKSREIFTKVFCNKIYLSHSDHEYHSFQEGGEYFENGLWTLGEDECFLDGGAYIGDTIDDFINKTNHRYEKIYSFEYEKDNYDVLQRRIREAYFAEMNKIELYNVGIWDKEDKGYCVYFGESDGTQIVSDAATNQNAQQCQLDALDHVLEGKRISVLKLDIEGAEINGLNGAKNIITRQKPKLAICLYHRPEDLWEIPCLIHEMNPAYKMIIKHHSMANFTDTVLYAVS